MIQETMRGIKPILLSANMALMAKMPLNKVYSDPDLKFHFDKACKVFGNEKQDQQQMLKDSLIGNLENAVRDVIEKSKADILIKKPINHIFQLANNKREELETSIKAESNTLKELKTPDTELEDKLDKIKKAQKRIERRIERATTELSDTFDEITNTGIDNMQKIVYDAKEDCMRIAGSARRNEVGTKLNARIDRLNQLELPKAQKTYRRNFVKALNNSCEDFANEVEEQLERYIDDCDGIKEAFRSAVGRGANSLRDSSEQFDVLDSSFENKSLGAWRLIPFVLIYSALSDWREDVYNDIQDHFKNYDFEELRNATLEKRPNYMSLLQTEATSKLLGELVEKLTEALDSKEKKEKLIQQTEESLAKNKRYLSDLEEQISELKLIVN